jgi:hypothetical protein
LVVVVRSDVVDDGRGDDLAASFALGAQGVLPQEFCARLPPAGAVALPGRAATRVLGVVLALAVVALTACSVNEDRAAGLGAG